MHYYQFHIGDYRSATAHLSNDEDLAYRRLLDMYYDTEQPIPLDTQWVSRRIRVASEVVSTVLQDMFTLTQEGWSHFRCETEIEDYKELVKKNRENGKKGGRPKKPSGLPVETDSEPKKTLTMNHEPTTINHKPKKEQQRGTRLPDRIENIQEWIDFCNQERPDLFASKVLDEFRDYWKAQPGQKGVKTDWLATWRNWVRRQRQEKNFADIARITVPSKNEPDPALVKIEKDRQLAKPPSLEVLAKMAELRKGT